MDKPFIAPGFYEHITAMGFSGELSLFGFFWWKPKNFVPYFQITRGKYAGTIGTISGWRGDFAVGDNITIPMLSPKSMMFLPNHVGSRKLVVKNPKCQHDINGTKLAIGDSVMFANNSHIEIGVVVATDPIYDKCTIATTHITYPVRSSKLTIVNDFDITTKKQQILMAILARN